MKLTIILSIVLFMIISFVGVESKYYRYKKHYRSPQYRKQWTTQKMKVKDEAYLKDGNLFLQNYPINNHDGNRFG
ncbi:hypothetical protein SNEBB_009495 [Seison nebaliae]|nr:hypothetical protein SNEBB_009495 [Seison nebaliae]